MTFKEKFKVFLNENMSASKLLPILMTLLIVWLINATWEVWIDIFNHIITILLPFIIGFTIAYLLRPIVVFFERYGVKRSISVTITLVAGIAALVLLFSSIIPSMYDDLSQFFGSISDSIRQIYDYYVAQSNNETSPIIDSIYQQIMTFINNTLSSVSNIPSFASSLISGLLGLITTTIFSLIIGIYFVSDYEGITRGIHKLANHVSPKLSVSITAIDQSVSSYLKSLIVIMFVSGFEYTLLYFLIGHNYALILGILSALSLLIPYVGPMLVHTIGILTALSLPFPRVIILAVALVVLSNVDGYVISPLIYSKRNRIEPLWSLFSLFACNVLFGIPGVLMSMPIYFSIRALLELRRNNWKLSEEN